MVGTALAIAGGIGAAVAAGGAVAKGVGEANASSAQAKAAQAQEAQARSDRAAAQAAAEPSAAELAQIDKNIKNSDTTIARQEKLISAIDPTIVEASNQALKLLKGEEAGALSPIRNERARQRAALESNLRNQLGSGYASSSAGSEALNRFDQQTSEALQGAQQNATNSLLGVSLSARQGAESANASANAMGLGVSQSLANIQNRRVNAITGTPLTPFAGSQYAPDIAAGKTLSAVGSGLSSLGGAAVSLAGSFGGGGSSGGVSGGGSPNLGVLPKAPAGGNIFGVGGGR